MARVAVIGGAGYVGIALCAELRRRGHDVAAVTRPSSRFLLERTGVRVEAWDTPERVGVVDVVINLAYPNRGPVHEYPIRNREIRDLIQRLAGAVARVIHVSTQAVFGFALEYPVVLGPVRNRRDYLYIEAKLELENLLARGTGRSLDIVRLGNVWGPASPTWTAAMADKLLFGEAVGVRGEDGYCNATDVANVVSYLAFLVEASRRDGARYHHLAELADTRWSWWIERLSRRLDVTPVYVEGRVAYPASLAGELRRTVGAHSPLTIAREWIFGRFTGSLLRSAVRSLPPATFAYLKRRRAQQQRRAGSGAASLVADPVFLTVMGAERRFGTVVDEAWTPPVDREASWHAVEQWVGEAGY